MYATQLHNPLFLAALESPDSCHKHAGIPLCCLVARVGRDTIIDQAVYHTLHESQSKTSRSHYFPASPKRASGFPLVLSKLIR